ncbi:MAG: DNA topoisomerase, partial [Lutibacter sp.]
KGGLSAGRVQSVAVRLIVEREREILQFKPVASYKVVAEFKNQEGKSFKATLPKNFDNKEEAVLFLKSCTEAYFKVADLQKKPAKKSPAAPFTTSTLQQEASRKLNFPVAKTMRVAQRLYEAGLITYMRTDSVNLSDDAKQEAKEEIIHSFGEKYSKPRNYKNKSKGAQEAHEAIRPTSLSRKTINVDFDQNRLYELIWKRTISSQMSEAHLERTTVKIANNKNGKLLVASGEIVKFDGFLKVYLEGSDIELEEKAGLLPNLTVNDGLTYNYITATERYTKAPYRYSEASLVKKLEELGIGRPSTYAPTISTIQRREYIVKGMVEGVDRNYTQLKLENHKINEKELTEKVGSDKGKLRPTDIGNIVNDFLVANFSEILSYNFTANVESEFDAIAEGDKNWSEMIKMFYTSFHPLVEDVTENAERAKGERLLGTDPISGKNVYARLGRYGAMVQIGEVSDEEKPKFASLQNGQTLGSITLDEALDLFKLPKELGEYQNEKIIVANGRFGPYIRYDKMFVSIPKNEEPLHLPLERAIELIQEKQKADAPIATYENLPVQKGVGRFGPFIKWNNMFINVSKKYDFDALSQEDIETLIEEKKKKEKEKVIHNWEEEGIRVEKARWGRSNIIQGKTKIELPKTVDAAKLTLEEVKSLIEKNKPKKKTSKRKTAKK